jgi:NAD(P)H-hydrate repair Nnr-like enzyme with NAD(P)H-hydrate epimerase domain
MENHVHSIAATATVWAINTGEAVSRRASQARERTRARLQEERGQTAAEYLGIILLVALIIAAVVGSGIAGDIANRVDKLVENIGQGKQPEGVTTTPQP